MEYNTKESGLLSDNQNYLEKQEASPEVKTNNFFYYIKILGFH